MATSVSVVGILCVVLGSAAAGVSAFVLGRYAFDVVRVRTAMAVRDGAALSAEKEMPTGFAALIVGIARTLDPDGVGKRQASHANEKDIRLVEAADMSRHMDARLLPALRLRIGVLLGAGLAFVAVARSATLALVALVIGLAVGRRLVDVVLESRARGIRASCETELPDLLDIVALAVRAGMSFDSALGVYCEGSDGTLSRYCTRARAEYLHGAKSRSDALRELATRLGIPMFSRFVDTVIQALHFGAPLSPALRLLSEEVRSSHKARVSERISKAPVKMLVPMALLILPAMLLLVLGPIVLNMLVEVS